MQAQPINNQTHTNNAVNSIKPRLNVVVKVKTDTSRAESSIAPCKKNAKQNKAFDFVGVAG